MLTRIGAVMASGKVKPPEWEEIKDSDVMSQPAETGRLGKMKLQGLSSG